MEGSHIQLGAELCRKYKESATVINAVESHHGDVEPTSLIACIVQAADTISAARPGARRETLETYTSRLKQLEDISNNFQQIFLCLVGGQTRDSFQFLDTLLVQSGNLFLLLPHLLFPLRQRNH